MQMVNNVPASTSDLRAANRCQVLQAFLEGGVRSAGEVAAQVGLSRQTVMKAVQFFLRTGLLVSDGKGESTNLGGKRPELFRLTKDRYFLCITLWPESVHVHLATIGGVQVGDATQAGPLPRDAREAINLAGRMAAELVRECQVKKDQVRAVSISTAGIVDYATGTLRYSSQTPAWGNDVPIQSWLRAWFDEDTILFVENTGKMAARPFLREPELARKRLLVIFSCWGLSSCLMDGGSILDGSNSLIGEIGHMTIDPGDPEQCGCGSRGCLERLVSAERLTALARQWAPEHPQSELAAGVTVPKIFQASRTGDPLARRLVAYMAGQFAIALRNISLVFDPEVVVFQGDYAHADAYFEEVLRQHIGDFQYFPENGPFALRFDRRELTQMDTQGSLIALSSRYFSNPALYTEDG